MKSGPICLVQLQMELLTYESVILLIPTFVAIGILIGCLFAINCSYSTDRKGDHLNTSREDLSTNESEVNLSLVEITPKNHYHENPSWKNKTFRWQNDRKGEVIWV